MNELIDFFQPEKDLVLHQKWCNKSGLLMYYYYEEKEDSFTSSSLPLTILVLLFLCPIVFYLGKKTTHKNKTS